MFIPSVIGISIYSHPGSTIVNFSINKVNTRKYLVKTFLICGNKSLEKDFYARNKGINNFSAHFNISGYCVFVVDAFGRKQFKVIDDSKVVLVDFMKENNRILLTVEGNADSFELRSSLWDYFYKLNNRKVVELPLKCGNYTLHVDLFSDGKLFDDKEVEVNIPCNNNCVNRTIVKYVHSSCPVIKDDHAVYLFLFLSVVLNIILIVRR